MSETEVCHGKTSACKQSGLSDADVQRLLLAYIGERTEVEEDELLAVLRWGHLMKQGAQLLEQALAGTVRLVVHDGAVIAARPVVQEATR